MTIKKKKLDIFLKELKEPEKYPGYLLWQTSNIWHRNMKNIMKRFGLTHTQFVVLTSIIYLAKNNNSINQKQIAQHAKLDIMMTSDVLKTLESKKLVTRHKNPNDKRHNSIKITQEGINLTIKMYDYSERADAEFFKVLGKDMKPFCEQLESLIKANYDNIYFRT